MQVYRGIQCLPAFPKGSVATIGNFDGVHCGHQLIIRQMLDAAERFGIPAVVMLFEPQPREFFEKDKAPPRLMTLREKLLALADQGVENALCVPFNQSFRSLTGVQFIKDVLLAALAIRHLVIGDDFRFGCDRAGDFAMLQQWGLKHGFQVEQTHTLEMNGCRVSSTHIRHLLGLGLFSEAASLLGRPYRLSGRVQHGQRLGRTLGVPTANLELKHDSPLQGVYVVSATLPGGERCHGVANIGRRPTVAGQSLRLEVHLFDFNGDLYGQRLDIYFLRKLRDEKKFAGIDELKAQLYRDLALAKQTIASRSVE
jgi:riboflavin kinase/FMN adenylyltransferase